jgi:hypothetical protein
MKKWIDEETGKMLMKARKRAGYTAQQVSDYVGYDLFFVETGLVSLGLDDVAELARLYKAEANLFLWQMMISTEVQLRKERLH